MNYCSFDYFYIAVRKSEATFYGFYSPDGFLDFDYDKCPEEWVSYSVDEHYTKQSINVENKHELESGRNSVSPTKNIWDALLQLDQHVIPPPFSTPNDLARVSQTPILSPDECSELISDCESHYYGWGSSHERYGTPKENVGYMIKLEDLSRSYSLVNFELLPRLFPAIMNAFPKLKTSPKNFRLGGCRIVKYDAADGHVELGLHRDGLFITANIALNNLDDYEGGGTYVEGLRDFMNNPIRLPKGHVMIHPGDVLHGGAPITKGVRYVLVCFILDTTLIPHEKHCQDRMQKDIEAARSIPSSDVLRAEERMQLLASATKNCADAYAFGKLAVCGERCNGYDDIVQNFERFVVAQDVASATALNAFQKVEMSEVEIA